MVAQVSLIQQLIYLMVFTSDLMSAWYYIYPLNQFIVAGNTSQCTGSTWVKYRLSLSEPLCDWRELPGIYDV